MTRNILSLKHEIKFAVKTKYPKVIAVHCSLFVLPACQAVFSPVTIKTGLVKPRATNF